MVSSVFLGLSQLPDGSTLVFKNKNDRIIDKLYQNNSNKPVGKCPLEGLPIQPLRYKTLPDSAKIQIDRFLHFHNVLIEEGENVTPTFREELKNTVTKLLPFAREVTKRYLHEQWEECPEDPLTFRNPQGYNRHGLVAATVLEAYLNALGFNTRLVGRWDLEPRITLATIHNLVEVRGSDQVRYLVDPSYIQFHKDLGIEEAQLPRDPVLILAEGEVDTYIEKHMMGHWRTIRAQVLAEYNEDREQGDYESMTDKLIEDDQILLYSYDFAKDWGVSKEIIPEDLEEWAREGFKRVWDLTSYFPIPADPSFHEIFYGTADRHATYDFIHSLGIGPSTTHLPHAEIRKQLGQSPNRPLSLIAQLPCDQRSEYGHLLDIDPRLQVDVLLNAYFRSLKKVVNPEERNLRVIYGCSGGDCSSVLLATDASDLIFVDLDEITYEKLSQEKNTDNFKQLYQDADFMYRRFWNMSRVSTFKEGRHYIADPVLKILFDLNELEIDLKELQIVPLYEGVRLEFDWQYHGSPRSRKRTITFLKADITKPEFYPALLKEPFDIFYMKGAYFVPKAYPEFLPDLVKGLKQGGWLMTTDKTFLMKKIDPERSLQEPGFNYVTQKSEETTRLEESLHPFYSYKPFDEIDSIRTYPRDKRCNRTSTHDLTYWCILNLRQKLEAKAGSSIESALKKARVAQEEDNN